MNILKPVRGLSNPSGKNICFLSTVLQSLFHAPGVADPGYPCVPITNHYYRAFKAIMRNMMVDTQKAYNYATNRELYAALMASNRITVGRRINGPEYIHLDRQNDVSEFINHFIEELGDCNTLYAPLYNEFADTNKPQNNLRAIKLLLDNNGVGDSVAKPVSILFQESLKGITLPRVVESGTDANKRYRLFSFIVNWGSDRAGHYIAYINTNNNQWFEFNDATVTRKRRINFKQGANNVITTAFYITEYGQPQAMLSHQFDQAIDIDDDNDDDDDNGEMQQAMALSRQHHERELAEAAAVAAQQAVEEAAREVESRVIRELKLVFTAMQSVTPSKYGKRGHWIWYLFPTNLPGANDPLHFSASSFRQASRLLENEELRFLWVVMLLYLADVLRVKNPFPEVDVGRINHYLDQWGGYVNHGTTDAWVEFAPAFTSFREAWTALQSPSGVVAHNVAHRHLSAARRDTKADVLLNQAIALSKLEDQNREQAQQAQAIKAVKEFQEAEDAKHRRMRIKRTRTKLMEANVIVDQLTSQTKKAIAKRNNIKVKLQLLLKDS